jgi:chromosome segregation protein
MDEVEPALDDVNLHRFISLVEGFARDAQVLIVTHQKRTMEVAGMMYGVSMGKDGTTRVVAQTLEHPADAAPAEDLVEVVDDEPVLVPEPDAVG